MAFTGIAAPACDAPQTEGASGYTYYNRPGASIDEHDKDVRACARVAGTLRGLGERRYAAAGLETCMTVRGWRVVTVPDSEGAALAALPATELAARLAPWIGAPEPHGSVVRVWDNAVARASVRFSGVPGPHRRGQLSLMAAAPDLAKLPSSPEGEPPSPWIIPTWPQKPLKRTDLATLRPDAAVLLVMIRRPGWHGGIQIDFNREGPDQDTYPSSRDHAPDKIGVGEGILLANPTGDMFAFAVPAGTWRIYGLGMWPVINLCLGSPEFEVKAGETVYAGAFDFSAEDLTPNMDLAPAKAWLDGDMRPLRAASYVNGSLGHCGDSGVDALEFKGAPFAPGYAWGSRAASQPVP